MNSEISGRAEPPDRGSAHSLSGREPIAFGAELRCSIEEIDRQHARMIEMVNRLLASAYDRPLDDADDELLTELIELTRAHFRTEEQWMRFFEYERLDVHAESHAHALHELVQLRDRLEAHHQHLNLKAVLFIRKWLEGHLLHMDRDMAEFLRPHVAAETG